MKKIMFNDMKIRYLCGMLPYRVRIREDVSEVYSNVKDLTVSDIDDLERNIIDDIKPYLRPMDSLTEEEREELILRQDTMLYSGKTPLGEAMMGLLDYVYEHHIDYFGLVEQGLALEAPEGMYDLRQGGNR